MAFWTGAWNNADDTTVFWLLLNSTCKTARLSLFPAPAPFPLPLRERMEEVATRLRGGDSWESWLQLVKGLLPTMYILCSATKIGAKEERAVFQGGCCSATGHQSDCGRIWVIAFAPFVPVPSFFHLTNGLYFDPPLLWLSFFLFPPAAHLGQQLCGSWAAGPGEPTTVLHQCRKFVTTTQHSGFFAQMKYYINISKTSSFRKPYILTFFLLLLTHKLRLSESESQKGWDWKEFSKSPCPKPIETHSQLFSQPTKLQHSWKKKNIIRIYY